MDWQAVGVIASSTIAVVALVVSILGQRSSDAQAKRSADAAERMATAMERQAIERERLSPIPGVVWELRHFDGDTYLLTNVGRAPAHDVHIDTGDLAIAQGEWDHEVVPPDDFIKFVAALTFGVADDTITVTWTDQPGNADKHSWSRPLPPRPRR